MLIVLPLGPGRTSLSGLRPPQESPQSSLRPGSEAAVGKLSPSRAGLAVFPVEQPFAPRASDPRTSGGSNWALAARLRENKRTRKPVLSDTTAGRACERPHSGDDRKKRV